MKITYIRLKNFSAIRTGMGKKTIEIDFTKCKNNIVLLVGVNGSGKTALLSTLHPFAYPGNMDVRANSAMILKDHSGEKEIHYNKDGYEYKISHYYKCTKTSMTVKSFISRDGEELNPNGNVTSFNEVVYNELGIQQDYLKVFRLGSNVTNIIEMKASERKNFTSDLFSELDMWSGLYKKVNDDYKMLRNLSATVSNKIQRLNIDDAEKLLEHISSLESRHKEINDNIDILTKRMGALDSMINSHVPEGVDVVKSEIKTLRSEHNSMVKQLKQTYNEMSDTNAIITGDTDNYITETKRTIDMYNVNRVSKSALVEQYKDMLNSYMNERDSIQKQLSSLMTDKELESLKSLYEHISTRINDTPERIKTYVPRISRDNLLTAINVLQEIERIGVGLYEFGKNAVNECIGMMWNNIDVNDAVEKAVCDIDKKISTLTVNEQTKIDSDCVVLFRPPSCEDDKCPYLDLYNRVCKKPENTDESLTTLENKREYLLSISAIYKNISYIGMILRTHKDLAKKLESIGIDYMDFDAVLRRIQADSIIFSEAVINRHISDIEEYEMYQKYINDIKDIELNISVSNDNSTRIEMLQNLYNQVIDHIAETEKNINTLSNEITDIDMNIDMLTGAVNDAITFKGLNDIAIEQSKHISTLSYDIKSKEQNLEDVAGYMSDLDIIKSQLKSYTSELKKIDDELFNAKYKYKTYVTLVKERELLNDRFEEVSVMKESLSSTKGAPLLYIQLYLQSTTLFVNNILSSVYDDFEINGFNISETEFNIPYTKNGVEINDVVYASQGERSFLSLALSFALIKKSIQSYNIMLLDEIDATLDIRNRAVFLNILMQMIDTIDAEQVFMITHNNMFDSYPVDVIMTSDVNLDNYKNANIIFNL